MTESTQSGESSMRDRVVLITGANTGIGLVTARELARQGAQVFIACRPSEKSNQALEQVRAAATGKPPELLALDLEDLSSVRRCSEAFLERKLPLHVLINNAGLAGARGRSKSGFELAFGVNHIGHFLFTEFLLPRLKASAPSRIVTVASRAHYRVKAWDWDALRRSTASRTGLSEYGVSKLANVLFSAELGRRLSGSGVNTYALHPGVVATDVWRSVPWPFRSIMKLGMISVEEGAKTTLHCATSATVASETGLYYDQCKPRTPSALGRDEALAAELWKRSADWVR